MGSDVMTDIIADRIRRVVELDTPIYFKHYPALGIQKDCPSMQSMKAGHRIQHAQRIQANLELLGEIPGSMLDMLEKKHNIVTNQ